MPVRTYHPNGNGTTQDWRGDTDFSNIDDGTEAPDVPGTDACFGIHTGSFNDSGLSCEWSTSNIGSHSGETTTNFSVYIYVDGLVNPPASVSCKINGSWQSDKATKDGTDGDWDYYDFAASHSIGSGMSDLQIRVTCPTFSIGQQAGIDGAYLEVSSVETGNPWNYFAQQGGI